MRHPANRLARSARIAAVALLLSGIAVGAHAQPYGLFLRFDGPPANNAYFEVPNSAALNPTTAITIELWVRLSASGDCRSLVGKDFTASYWVGSCGNVLRAYFRGSGSAHDAGIIPNNQFTHLAVTYDGHFQKHYINGELIHTFAVSGAPTASTAPLRIGSDVSFAHAPTGEIDEVRIWSVARTVDQIRSTINVPLSTPQPGLVAVWPFQSLNDPVGGHNGTLVNEDAGVSAIGLISLGYPLGPCSGIFDTELCLNNRFSISARFRVGAPGTAEDDAHTVNVPNPGSGLFWFFAPDNWEVMVKEINGCGLNNHHWIFSAATTNVFYRLTVYDNSHAEQKIYFNYPGPPAPAVTDINAFPWGSFPACP